jgi:hypothetical protein
MSEIARRQETQKQAMQKISNDDTSGERNTNALYDFWVLLRGF